MFLLYPCWLGITRIGIVSRILQLWTCPRYPNTCWTIRYAYLFFGSYIGRYAQTLIFSPKWCQWPDHLPCGSRALAGTFSRYGHYLPSWIHIMNPTLSCATPLCRHARISHVFHPASFPRHYIITPLSRLTWAHGNRLCRPTQWNSYIMLYNIIDQTFAYIYISRCCLNIE